jgi:hypothetical protein
VKKLPCLEAHSILYSQKKFQKITTILDASSSMTKSPKSHFGGKGALGVKLKFGGRNLFSPAMTSTIEGNNSVGSLLKKVTPVVGSRML